MGIVPLTEPQQAAPHGPRRSALLALGFRPFYLLAAGFAAIVIPAWLAMFAGLLPPPPAFAAVPWHAHEMLFGFACAVICGFLFTAGRAWTGLDTPTGTPLAMLAGLWLCGRVAFAIAPAGLAAAIDLAFLPAVAIALGRVLLRAGNKRNYFVLVLLAALFAANLLFHLRAAGVLGGDPLQAVLIGLALVTTLETVIGGRIIPNFTSNGLGGLRIDRNQPLEKAAIALTIAALLAWALAAPGWAVVPLAALAGALQIARSLSWRPGATLKTPLLWILHLSHGWIALGLLLIAAAGLGWTAASVAVHALAIGAMAGLIMGMITRTSLGHTGRALVAGSIETACYVLVHVAVLTRILPSLVAPDLYWFGLLAAGAAWSGAFLLYLLRYGPILWRPRIDGRPG